MTDHPPAKTSSKWSLKKKFGVAAGLWLALDCVIAAPLVISYINYINDIKEKSQNYRNTGMLSMVTKGAGESGVRLTIKSMAHFHELSEAERNAYYAPLSVYTNTKADPDAARLAALPAPAAEAEARALVATTSPEALSQRLKARTDADLAFTMTLLDSMMHNGLDESEREVQRSIFAGYETPAAVRAAEDAVITSTVDRLSQSAEFRNLRTAMTSLSHVKTEAQAKEQLRVRQDLTQLVSDTVRAEFGMNPVPVFLTNLYQPLGGFYSRCFDDTDCPADAANDPGLPLMKNGFIALNMAPSYGIMDDFDTTLTVLIEEIKHSVDIDTAHNIPAGTMERTDPRYAHSMMILASSNAAAYEIGAMKITENGYSITLSPASLYDTFYAAPRRYENQYVERNAKDFTRRFKEGLKAAAPAP